MAKPFLAVENCCIGVIADTHTLFDLETLKGADHILHAGDIGDRSVIEQLEQIAPFTATQSVPLNVPRRRCCSWKTGEHEEQDPMRLTVDVRMLTI